MATTPNFGWVTPAPTDFVTDLPADFETFADAVDADVQLIKNTADAALPETIIDAAGDLIYGSAADTAARLAIGTAGQVLAVNSGATAPEWKTIDSGSFTQLATGTLNTSGIVISSIPTTYKSLRLVLEKPRLVNNGSAIQWRYNSDTATNYINSLLNSETARTWNNDLHTTLVGISNAANDNLVILDIPEYANANTYKLSTLLQIASDQTNTANAAWARHFGAYKSTTAITSITLVSDFQSGTYYLFGVK